MAGRSAQLRHDSGPVRHAVPHVSSTILIPAPAFGSGFRISNSEDPAPNLLDPDRRTLSRNHRRDDIEFTGNVASRKNVNERSVHSAEGVEPAASVGPSVGIKARCSHLARTRQRKRRPGSAKTSELRCCRASTGRGRASTPTPAGSNRDLFGGRRASCASGPGSHGVCLSGPCFTEDVPLPRID